MTSDPETQALLKILELGNRQATEGRVHDAREAIAKLRKKLDEQAPSTIRSDRKP
jgi:hypothetical protein